MTRPLARALPALAALLVATACTPPVEIPDEERSRAAHELEGETGFLQVAAFAAPFFGDETKLLLSDAPLTTLDLLETPNGERIDPPPPERVLPPGTRVRVSKVEFPTGWTIAKRMLHTPRYHPWVYLTLAGEDRPLVVVLGQRVANAEEARAELGRLVGPADPTPRYASLPEAQRAAVAKKQLAEGMSTTAVELAWGYPTRKVIDRPAGTENWSWMLGDRTAAFAGGKLVHWADHAPARKD